MTFTHEKWLIFSLLMRNICGHLMLIKGFAFGNSSISAVKLTKNADPDKYSHYGYHTGFDAHIFFFII